jgi:EmrB/QacA subfamily drug resistance transporter
MFLGSIFMTIAATAMPRIITDLGGFSQYTWVFTAYIITETIAVPLTGKLSDMYGRKWFFIVGMAIFTLGSFLCGISQSMTELIFYRAFQGIGFGMMSALGFIIIADIFPPEERGKYMGIMSGVFGLSTIIGPTLGGYLTDALSWRWCFFVPIPIGAIIVILCIFMFPQLKAGETRHRVDYGGVVTLTLFVAPLIMALTWGGVDYAWNSPVIIGSLVFSMLMLVAFVLIEARAAEPIVPLALFRNRVLAVSAIVTFFMGASFFTVVNFVPLFFQGVLGTTATASGGFLTPMMLSSSVGSFFAGQILSRTGGYYRLLATIGFVISGVGLYMLSMMTPETSTTMAVIYIIIIGTGNGLVMPIHTLAVQNTVPYAIMGTATSMIALLRPLGGVFGIAVVGTILNNTFASSFLRNLAPGVKAVMSPEQLAAIVDNPQALVSVEAQEELQSMFQGVGDQGPVLFEQMITTLRNALSSALVQVFLVFLFVTVLAIIVNFFLKGIPPLPGKKAGTKLAVEDAKK